MLKSYEDHLFTILPFENDGSLQYGWDQIAKGLNNFDKEITKIIPLEINPTNKIALLTGSKCNVTILKISNTKLMNILDGLEQKINTCYFSNFDENKNEFERYYVFKYIGNIMTGNSDIFIAKRINGNVVMKIIEIEIFNNKSYVELPSESNENLKWINKMKHNISTIPKWLYKIIINDYYLYKDKNEMKIYNSSNAIKVMCDATNRHDYLIHINKLINLLNEDTIMDNFHAISSIIKLYCGSDGKKLYHDICDKYHFKKNGKSLNLNIILMF